jgi:hypothetical protein
VTDQTRNCTTCNYCRLDTDAESVATYGKPIGFGTCYGKDPGARLKAPGTTCCDQHWDPCENPSFLPDGTPNPERYAHLSEVQK